LALRNNLDARHNNKYGTGKAVRKVRPEIPENSNENDIYVGLASYLAYAKIDPDNDCYNLVTLVSASDYKGKILINQYVNTIKVRLAIG